MKIEFDDKELIKLLENAKINYYAEIGVFDKTNATKGATHEFGSISHNVPKRSWLKMPLEEHKDELLQTAKDVIANNIKENNIDNKQVANQLGLTAESIVKKAFTTGGFGKWEALKQSTIEAKKGNKTILVDKAELVNAVRSRVKKG